MWMIPLTGLVYVHFSFQLIHKCWWTSLIFTHNTRLNVVIHLVKLIWGTDQLIQEILVKLTFFFNIKKTNHVRFWITKKMSNINRYSLITSQSISVNPCLLFDDWPFESCSTCLTIRKSALPRNFSFSFSFINFKLHNQKRLELM